VERLPDGTEEFDWAIHPDLPMDDERLSLLLAEMAERI
jgi:hypothetical protein